MKTDHLLPIIEQMQLELAEYWAQPAMQPNPDYRTFAWEQLLFWRSFTKPSTLKQEQECIAWERLEAELQFPLALYGTDGLLAAGLCLCLARLDDDRADEFLDYVDTTLAEQLGAAGNATSGELFRGLAGALLYLASRPPSEMNLQSANWILSEFECRIARGPSHVLDGETFVLTGMAHGLAGPLAALSIWYTTGQGHEHSRQLASALAQALAGQLLALNTLDAAFPAVFSKSSASEYQETSWCNGYLGIVAALSVAEPVTGRSVAHLRAGAAQRMDFHARHRDDCLCHGTAGTCLTLYHWGKAFGCKASAASAVQWLTELVKRRDTSRQPGGYHTLLNSDEQGIPSFGPSGRLLVGAAGNTLALATIGGVCSDSWQRLLALS